MLRRAFVLGALLSLLQGCGSEVPSSQVETNLGGGGNSRILNMFKRYVAAREDGILNGCSALGERSRRILVQGFGPFESERRNISGQVVSSLSNPDFWPSKVSLDNASPVPSIWPATGEPGSMGATAVQRTLEYNGIVYEVCFVVAEVQWDFAAAVTIFEAQKFRPQFVLLSGRGNLAATARLETLAINEVVALPGFDRQGSSYPSDEIPVTSRILVGPGVEEQDAMTWHPERFQSALEPATAYLKNLTGRVFNTKLISYVDRNNNYICNNISFVLLHAAKNVPLSLAGGLIEMKPNFAEPFRVGFFHYPLNSGTTAEAVYGWSHLIMTLVEAELGQ